MRRVHMAELPVVGEFEVAGDEGHHLVRVLRARKGDHFGVFDGRGREVEAEVLQVARRSALLAIVGERTPRRPARHVDLIVAAPKGARMEWLIEKCTEAGVARVLPFAAARGARGEASANTLRRWERAALEAAKQCGRADVPEVRAPLRLAELLDVVEAPLLVADPAAAEAPLGRVLPAGPVALVIGAEGGFEDAERALLTTRGALPFSLGDLILRIETAAVVAVHASAWAPATDACG